MCINKDAMFGKILHFKDAERYRDSKVTKTNSFANSF